MSWENAFIVNHPMILWYNQNRSKLLTFSYSGYTIGFSANCMVKMTYTAAEWDIIRNHKQLNQVLQFSVSSLFNLFFYSFEWHTHGLVSPWLCLYADHSPCNGRQQAVYLQPFGLQRNTWCQCSHYLFILPLALLWFSGSTSMFFILWLCLPGHQYSSPLAYKREGGFCCMMASMQCYHALLCYYNQVLTMQ